jgi:hypothetical protein
MAIARQTDTTKIRPLAGALTRQYTAGATIAIGELVAMSADGFLDPADTTSADATVVGIALEAAVTGDKLAVCTYGAVTAVTGGTPGATLHASDTAGEPAESAGTNSGVAGRVDSATTVFINPPHVGSATVTAAAVAAAGAIMADGSTTPSTAAAYVSSASASDAITATTYLNVLGNATVTDSGTSSADWTIDDTNKRLTYTGTATRTFSAVCTFSMVSTQSNQVASFRFAKNGTTVAATQVNRKIGTGSDEGAAAITGIFSLATNDYIELHATLAASSSDTITINTASFIVSQSL